jgi:hypothetical protein
MIAIGFIAIAICLILGGVFMVLSGRDVVPDTIRARLRRVAASPRDQRLVGASVILGALAVLFQSVAIMSPVLLLNLASLLCLTGWIISILRVRRLDRRNQRISSGWNELTEVFRPHSR